MSITGIDGKRMDELLDNANGLITEVRGKLSLIDAAALAEAIMALKHTAANLQVVSEKLMRVVEMLK